MQKTLIILFSIIFLGNCKSQTMMKNDWESVKVKNQTLVFGNGVKFKTNLYDLKYIGYLNSGKEFPYFVFSGRTCQNCDENISIFIHSPSDGPIHKETKLKRYLFPGRLYDMETGKLILESRAFIGNCLPEKSNIVIWYQNSLDELGKWKKSVYIVEVSGNKLEEYMITDSLPDIEVTLKLVSKKICYEIPGLNQTTEP